MSDCGRCADYEDCPYPAGCMFLMPCSSIGRNCTAVGVCSTSGQCEIVRYRSSAAKQQGFDEGGEQDNAASSARCTPAPVAGADGKGGKP